MLGKRIIISILTTLMVFAMVPAEGVSAADVDLDIPVLIETADPDHIPDDILTADGADGSGDTDYGQISGTLEVPDLSNAETFCMNKDKWKVIGKCTDNNSKWLVIAADLINVAGANNTQETAMTWKEAMNKCGTYAFTDIGEAYIQNTSKTDGEYKYNNNDTYKPAHLDEAKIFLLSAAEQRYYISGKGDQTSGHWWLRSEKDGAKNDQGELPKAGCSKTRGALISQDKLYTSAIGSGSTSYPIGFRPAFVFSPANILFTSAATGGKYSAATDGSSFGSLNATDQNGDKKFTFLDSSRSSFSASIGTGGNDPVWVSSGGKVDISYINAPYGENEYVSAMLLDGSDNIIGYASTPSGTSGNGTWTLTLPSNLPANAAYTLKVFSEQQNGDKMSDCVSPIRTVNLKVKDKVATPTISPENKAFIGSAEVSLACATKGATIHYTIDESVPTASSNEYTAPITVTETTTIKAVAIKENMEDSDIAVAKYTLISNDYSADTDDGKFSFTVTDIGKKYVSIRKKAGTLPSGTLEIPSTVQLCGDNFTVTSIGDNAFRSCSGLTGELTIPNSVTSIGNDAFYNCSGFNGELTIPDSVSEIGERAFCYCSGLTGELTIPDSVTNIGEGAFCRCSGLTGDLTIPGSVSKIGEYAFSDCSGFTGDLTIPASVISIGKDAFWDCSGFTGELTIPASVTSIEYGAFFDTKFATITNASKINIPCVQIINDYTCTYSYHDKSGNTVDTIGKGTYKLFKSDCRVTISTGGNGTAGANIGHGKTGTTVEITATPNDGYVFDKWIVLSGAITLADPAEAVTTFDIGVRDVEVMATFVKKTEPAPDPEANPTPTPGPGPESDPEAKPTPAPEPEPGPTPAPSKISIEKAAVKLSKASFNYNDKVQKPSVKSVTLNGKTLSADRDYNISWSNSKSKAVGKYTVTITGKGNYTDSVTAEYKIVKGKNPLTVKVKKKTLNVPYSKLEKGDRTIKRSKYLKVSKTQGKVTYRKSKGNKKITVNKSTGKITVRKGLKKGTYSVTISVKAAGNKNYKSLTKKATVKIVVK